MLIVWLQHPGGAISRGPPTAAAYGRGASHTMGLAAFFPSSGDAGTKNRGWVKRAWDPVEPLTHGNYVNIANTDDREARIHAAYGQNYPRLVRLKKQHDPNNLFRPNANIKPA
jgi:Berberine and berberine like